MQWELIHAHIRNLARETGIKVFTFAEVRQSLLDSVRIILCSPSWHGVGQIWRIESSVLCPAQDVAASGGCA